MKPIQTGRGQGLALTTAMLITLLLLAACGQMPPAERSAPARTTTGNKLRVIATTNIVADVVRQVGGDKIELTALLPPGSDPHSYQATPDDLRRLNDAQVIFVNGLHLEEAMAPVLENLDTPTPVVSVNDGVVTRELNGEEHDAAAAATSDAHDHDGVDPHTWMNPANVVVWSENITRALSELDPANAASYTAAAAAYVAELKQLDDELRTQFATIPVAQRKLVTDHDNLGYLADAYGFTVLGSVIPSLSTMAAPSAQEMAALQNQIKAEGASVILVGNTVNPAAAEQLARDTGAQVVPIYSGSLSDEAGAAASYIAMMRFNAAAILAAFGQ